MTIVASEEGKHVPLMYLWAYRASKTPLSPDQLKHLFSCNECMSMLGICQISNTFQEVERYRRERADSSSTAG